MNRKRNVSFPALFSILMAIIASLACCDPSGKPRQVITLVAGTGAWTSTGDGGPATAATIMNPNGIALDSAGVLYFSDSNGSRIRSISTAGIVSAFAGTGVGGQGGDGGAALSAQFAYPQGLAMGSGNVLFVADSNNCRIRRIDSAGTVTTYAGGGLTYRFAGDGGPAAAASLSYPTAVALDAQGNLYIADCFNNRIRKVDSGGTISTIAGTGTAGNLGDEGPAASAQLNNPWGVAVDGAGNVYIADTNNNRIRIVDTAGIIHTIAGTGVAGTSGDGGLATAAQLTTPKGVCVDSSGNVYVADWGNFCVREIATDGTIATIAGTCGTQGWNTGDGDLATAAGMMNPIAIVIDAAGSIIIADEKGDTIRKVRAP